MMCGKILTLYFSMYAFSSLEYWNGAMLAADLSRTPSTVMTSE